MDMKELTRLKELAEKATPGPWRVSHNPHSGNFGLSSACIGPHELRKFAARELTDVIKGEMAHLLPVCVVPEAWPVNEEKKGPVIDAQRNNAAWLAALAPENILALISELEALQKEVNWLAMRCQNIRRFPTMNGRPEDDWTAYKWREAARKAVKDKTNA